MTEMEKGVLIAEEQVVEGAELIFFEYARLLAANGVEERAINYVNLAYKQVKAVHDRIKNSRNKSNYSKMREYQRIVELRSALMK